MTNAAETWISMLRSYVRDGALLFTITAKSAVETTLKHRCCVLMRGRCCKDWVVFRLFWMTDTEAHNVLLQSTTSVKN